MFYVVSIDNGDISAGYDESRYGLEIHAEAGINAVGLDILVIGSTVRHTEFCGFSP